MIDWAKRVVRGESSLWYFQPSNMRDGLDRDYQFEDTMDPTCSRIVYQLHGLVAFRTNKSELFDGWDTCHSPIRLSENAIRKGRSWCART